MAPSRQAATLTPAPSRAGPEHAPLWLTGPWLTGPLLTGPWLTGSLLTGPLLTGPGDPHPAIMKQPSAASATLRDLMLPETARPP